MLRKRFRIRYLNTRITLYFSLVFLFALLILVTVTSRLFTDKLTMEMNMVMQQKLDLASTILEHSLAEIKALHFSLIDNPVLQFHMQQLKANDDFSDNIDEIILIKDEINRTIERNANVRSAFAISLNREILNPIYTVEPYNSIVKSNKEFDYFLNSHLNGRFSAPSTFPIQVSNPQYNELNTITYFGRYYNNHTYEELGYIAINLTKYSIFNEIETLFSGAFERIYVIDENNSTILETVPFSSENLAILHDDYEQGEIIRIDGHPFAAFSRTLSNYPNWRILGFVNFQNIYTPIRHLYTTVFLVSIAVMFVMILISFSISRRVTDPIRSLRAAMIEVGKGGWPKVEELNSGDEISDLVKGFNSMVDSLRKLNEAIKAEQEEKKKIEVAMIQSQLDLLQSQINPHFIHNTLNTMKYMAKKEGADELADLIVSFNSLLRASMSQNYMFATVLEEVENINNYIKIQRKRYDVIFEFYCDISDSSRDILIPKLILQPLVENSLFHGIIPNGGGRIVVSTRTAEGRLWVNVWDNGTGIPPEKLELIVNGILPNSSSYNKIGLKNVNERLILNYGYCSRLVIDSQVGKGTSINFSIPATTHQSDVEYLTKD